MKPKKIDRHYYPDGSIRSEITYFPDGTGVTRSWHPNGTLDGEIPWKGGLPEGRAREWNEKGELVGEYEMYGGTGVMKQWHPNGQMKMEVTYIGGDLNGPTRFWAEDGTVDEIFFINEKQVSRRKYEAARESNPQLPPPYSTHEVSPEVIPEPSAPERQTHGVDLVGMIDQSNTREAREWLQESPRRRTLGESLDYDESLRLVEELYKKGAAAVFGIEIDKYEDDQQNTGKLIVELPAEPRRRKSVFKYCAPIARERGFDPDQDIGQKYILLMLD